MFFTHTLLTERYRR